MSIPKLTKDLAVIQKLSDLPNSADGLTAAELKAKFDEAALEIQKWINNSLIPTLTAANIPFAASEQLNADNIQAAVQLVFEQIADASSGTIANGSVTKEKLASALLNRVFGGRVWVSLDKPTEENSPATEFPVGQIWLRPSFTVNNVASDHWTATSCTVQTEENKVIVTGDSTYSQADAVMNLSGIGQDGDRVYVLFGIGDKDSEITSLTVSLNGGEEENTSKAVHTATLSGGALSVRFRAVWPSSSLANGSYSIENLAVVNIDQIMRQTADCREMADWGAYLQTLLPFASYVSPRELYIQTTDGIWQQFDHEVFPVDRGGTGRACLGMGEMLYGNGTEKMEVLPAAEENSLLQFADGIPQWRTPGQAAQAGGLLQASEQTYVGTGSARTIQLPGSPVVLWLRDGEQTYQFFRGTKISKVYDGKYTTSGGVLGEMTSSAVYKACVVLDADILDFRVELPELPENARWTSGDAVHLNEEGKQYTWTAIY